ncbi:hypothetical protein PRVXT_000940 [Proteinivorax tanatarense]|uniref:Uncharacterized protein n=1 Tax=Proteinivorax tanatarense TaxID=1260629 RepID=A0AAU7VNR2_9FIRM
MDSNKLYKEKMQARYIAVGVADKVLADVENLSKESSSEGTLGLGTYNWSYVNNQLKITAQYKNSIYNLQIEVDSSGTIFRWIEY